MKIKTSELTSAALDWAVAQALGVTPAILYGSDNKTPHIFDADLLEMEVDSGADFDPTTNWGLAGPIIEREMIDLRKVYSNGRPSTNPYDCWKAEIVFRDEKLVAGDFFAYGPTPLIAAMRCFVTKALGDEVEVPEELCTS